MNILLINDSSSNPNWGDRAAAIALKRMIGECGATLSGVITEDNLLESRFFEEPLEPFRSYPEKRNLRYWARLFFPPVFLKIWNKISSRLQNGKESGRVHIPDTIDEFDQCIKFILNDWKKHSGLISAIETADLAVIHGDGCMVGNGIMPRSELFLGYLIKTQFKKPVILINHTTDFNHPELNRMAEKVYPLLVDVTYRDQISEELCKGRWPGRYAADTAFQFKPADRNEWVPLAGRPTYFDIWPDQAAFDPAQPYVCIGGSSIYSFSFDHYPVNIINDFVSLLCHLKKIYNGQIVLTASDLKDQFLFRPVAKTLNLPLVGLNIPVQQAVDIIGNADAYIGGRWHPGIFALRGGTPVIPLSSKTFKMKALIKMAGLQIDTFGAIDLKNNYERIGRRLCNFLSEGKTLRGNLRKWAESQVDSSWDNISYLRHCLSSDNSLEKAGEKFQKNGLKL